MRQQWGPYEFFDDWAEGAWPNGTRIVKAKKIDAEELVAVGTSGTVLGSMQMPPDAIKEQLDRGLNGVKYGYFVEWDIFKRMPVFCIDVKLAILQ